MTKKILQCLCKVKKTKPLSGKEYIPKKCTPFYIKEFMQYGMCVAICIYCGEEKALVNYEIFAKLERVKKNKHLFPEIFGKGV